MKSVLIIGLGRFGHHLCIDMANRGNEVMVIDKDEKKTPDLLEYATAVRVGDCTNEEVLRSLGVGNFDLCFVCIGSNFQSSLEITSLVKELGAKHVVSKANRDIHAKFLLRNGADEVFYPEYATAMADAGASALELNIFIQPTDIHAQARELELNYAEIVGRVAGAVKIPVSVKLPMRLTNVFALSSALLGYGARGVVFFNRFFEPDVDVERMTFVESSPYSEPTELRNVLRMVAICSAVLPQLDLSVSTGVHDGEAAVKALLCGAEAVQVCTAIHQKGFEVIAEMNEYIDRWAERQGFGSLDEFRGRLNFKNDTSAMFQRVQYMKYFPSEAK